jgi:hypothetical protein
MVILFYTFLKATEHHFREYFVLTEYRTVQPYNADCFISVTSVAFLSRRKLHRWGILRDSCGVQDSDKRNTVY